MSLGVSPLTVNQSGAGRKLNYFRSLRGRAWLRHGPQVFKRERSLMLSSCRERDQSCATLACTLWKEKSSRNEQNSQLLFYSCAVYASRPLAHLSGPSRHPSKTQNVRRQQHPNEAAATWSASASRSTGSDTRMLRTLARQGSPLPSLLTSCTVLTLARGGPSHSQLIARGAVLGAPGSTA